VASRFERCKSERKKGMHEPKVTRAEIRREPRLPGESDFAYWMRTDLPTVHAWFDDGTEGDLFSYYPDELSFTPEEFAGLTEEQAWRLFRDKDVEYLRS